MDQILFSGPEEKWHGPGHIISTLLKSFPSSKMGSPMHSDYVKQVPGLVP